MSGFKPNRPVTLREAVQRVGRDVLEMVEDGRLPSPKLMPFRGGEEYVWGRATFEAALSVSAEEWAKMRAELDEEEPQPELPKGNGKDHDTTLAALLDPNHGQET